MITKSVSKNKKPRCGLCGENQEFDEDRMLPRPRCMSGTGPTNITSKRRR
jgi:hypothetical protein